MASFDENQNSPCKVLITGAGGWLAQFMHKKLVESNSNLNLSIHGTFRGKCPRWMPASNTHEVDLTEPDKLDLLLQTLQPHVILHLAGLTSPGAFLLFSSFSNSFSSYYSFSFLSLLSILGVCKKDPSLAFAVNKASALVAAVKKHCPASLFIFTSTDLVFDGENPPYKSQDSATAPVNVYGQSKAAFEPEVLSLNHGVVLRLSNMLGPKFCYEPAGKKFLEFLFDSFKNREYIGLRYDEIRSFVSVHDVVNLIHSAIKAFCSKDERNTVVLHGAYNVGGKRGGSRLDLGTALCSCLQGSLVVHEAKQDLVESSSSSFTTVTANSERESEFEDKAVQQWCVFKQSNQESIAATAIENPKDVTMVVSDTERNFEIQFSDVLGPTSTAMEELLRSFA